MTYQFIIDDRDLDKIRRLSRRKKRGCIVIALWNKATVYKNKIKIQEVKDVTKSRRSRKH